MQITLSATIRDIESAPPWKGLVLNPQRALHSADIKCCKIILAGEMAEQEYKIGDTVLVDARLVRMQGGVLKIFPNTIMVLP
jgi:hypothetical protein